MKRINNLLFIVIIFTVCLWDVGSLERIKVVDDGFCYWGIAATLSGYDWKELISASAYYSYGYSIILIPLFWLNRLGLSMALLYRLAIVLNAVFLSGCYLMILYMLKELFEDIPDGLKQIMSLFVTLYIGNTAQMSIAWTETFLLFMFWCVVVSLYRVLKKPSYWNILALVAATAWSFAIHMRSIGVVAAVCVVMLCFFISQRKKLDIKYIIYTLVLSVIFCAIVLLIKNYVVNHIYLGTAVNSVNNVQANVTRVGRLLSVRGILDLALSVIGKLYYISTESFILIMIGALTVLVRLIKTFRKNEVTGKREKWQLKDWMMIFILLSFCAEIGIESIFQCIPFFRDAQSQMRDDSLAFGRYANFVMGPMILIGLWAVYHLKEHYKEILFAVLISIFSTGIVQFLYNIMAFRKKTSTVGFRFAASPWLSIIMDGHKTDFAYSAMMISICILLVLCLIRIMIRSGWRTFAAMLIALSIMGGAFGIIGGMRFTESKLNKAKTVDTVAEIVDVIGEDVQIYVIDKPNTEVKVLQWLIAKRSIHTGSFEDINDIDIYNSLILADSTNVKLVGELSDRLDFLYDSGYIAVFADKESSFYESASDMAKEMAKTTDPTIKNISLSEVATDYSYTKSNGGLYYNYEASEGAYLTQGMGIVLEDGIYEFNVDIRIRECVADTEIGYITVGDTEGNIQYTYPLNANDFIEKQRRNIKLSLEIKDWAEPLIGIYTYGNSSIKVCGIDYRKVESNVGINPEEENEIAGMLGADSDIRTYYIDSDNSAFSGLSYWEYGELVCLSGTIVKEKENLEDIPFIVEKTDPDIISFFENKLSLIGETRNYAVYR